MVRTAQGLSVESLYPFSSKVVPDKPPYNLAVFVEVFITE